MVLQSTAGFLSQWWRLGGILGIGAVAFIFIGIGVTGGGSVDFESSIGEIRTYFTDDATQYLVGDYLIGLGFVLLFLPFVVTLRGLLGLVEGGANIWSRLAFTGGLLMVAVGFASSIAWGTLALGAAAHPEVSDSTLRTLMYADAYGFTMLALVSALLLFPASVVILTSRVLWRWLALLGIAAGILVVIGVAWVIDGDQESALGYTLFIGMLGVALWVLLVSINMLLKRELPARGAN